MKNICELPLMNGHCTTCPFKPDSKGVWQNPELANEVIRRTFLQAQQVCHGTELNDRTPRHRCKGAFDFCKEIYERMGLTDFIIKEKRKL